MDELNTNNIGRSDAAILVDEDAEGEGPSEDDDAGDFDAIVSVQVADAGEEPDTTVVVEIALCGNGQPDTGEECDQGASNSDTAAGACRVNCRKAYCGDGVVDEGEACDHGASNSDGEANACRTNCTVARCGDNFVDMGEQCDSGDARSDTVAGACRMDCHSARCGDGVVDTDEGCDDGNAVDTDMCRNTCRSARCGDHVVDPEEQCDDGNNTSGDGCQATCRTPRCGDRVMDTGEQCDDGNIVENDGCRSNCRSGCMNDAACADGAFCNGIERCLNGLCNPGASLNRSDNLPCTEDACDEGRDLITHTPNDSLCNVPAPTCDEARGTTRTVTCSATRGCVEVATTTACSDAPSVCQRRGDGSYTLLTYDPVCEDTMSCGDATSNSNSVVCAHIPASCDDRVFTARATATCDPDAESCGNNTPNVDDCKTRDATSCAAGNVSFTSVMGTCGANGCGSTTTGPTACPDPADTCTNAVRRTYTPTCNASSGCGAAAATDTRCTQTNPPRCGGTGPNGQAALQTYTPACDPSGNGQCSTTGTVQSTTVCTPRVASTCSLNARVPQETRYTPACTDASSCSADGSGTTSNCTARTDTSCAVNAAGVPQQTSYAPACEDATRCLSGGRAVVRDCGASSATGCQYILDRANLVHFVPACDATDPTICSADGAQVATLCTQQPIACSGTSEVRSIGQCSNNACATSTTQCTQRSERVCSSATSFETRRYMGGCTDGTGCAYVAAGATACSAPTCGAVVGTNIIQACTSSCTTNSDGAFCQSTCTTCANGCLGTSCRLVLSPVGGVVSVGGAL